MEEAVPVYYEEEINDDDNIDPSLLDDYVLLDLEHASVVSDAELEAVPAITLTNNSSSPPPSSLVEVRMGERMIVSFASQTILL